ncbi:MAG: FecR domain-containing protein [Gammaproteobacteria bacterium]|nr:FecR domain-containing protein [Gammaproteobacteria bacterium]NNJ50845.1 LysM peptidoglycan-binding domain-containing protein [Gammaproteobacteria bacterium]
MLRFITTLLFMLSISLPGLVTAEEEYWEYTFRPGDSIWKIAEKYTTSVNNWDEIQKINKIRQGPDRKIRPGTRIVIPVSMLKLQPTPAVVIAVSGDAILFRANGEESAIATGTKLYNGDRVVTADKQSLRMQFADKSELQVLSNSEVVLDKLSHHKDTGMVDTRIRLNNGSVNTWVEKQRPDSHYEIRTPAAITAVRGTAFRLSSDSDNISRTEVTEGIVAVSAGDAEKDVPDGFGIVAEKDKPLPEPVKLLDAPDVSDNMSADRSELHVSWKELDGAKAYRYRLASDEQFNQTIIDGSTEDSSIKLTDLAPGQYYLQVRAIDQYKLEGIDAVNDYDIQQPPPPPPPVVEDDSWKVILITGIIVVLMI